MNYFAHATAAGRYARSRPYFHPLVVARIKNFLQLREPLARALDVACGTGQSTVALQEIATETVGTDVSADMLRQARRAHEARETALTRAISYVEAPAASQPFPDASFDLITVSMAFHWFDRAAFLREAWRLLRPDRWLVVYNNFFYGTMQENPAFTRWHRDSYLARYPNPPRDSQPLTADQASRHGFHFAAQENYTNDVSFTPEQLAAYLTTQSNIIAAVEHGTENFDSIQAWLDASLAPLFPAPQCTFNFGGHIWYMAKK